MSILVDFYKKHGQTPAKYIEFKESDDPLNLKSALTNAFKMSPQKAIEFLEKKAKNIKFTQSWKDLDTEAHSKAFTVSKVASADLLQDIIDKLIKAEEEGLSLEKFKEEIELGIYKTGWLTDESGAVPSRLATIFNTNSQMAFALGQIKQQTLITDDYPYWLYQQIERKTKRHDHTRFHNKVFKATDPIWKSIYPPSGFNCKCVVIPVTESEAKSLGATIEDGKDFEKDIDPNHISPFDAYQPETNKYVNGIKEQLEKFLE